jgi:hypothetical protein
VPRKIHRRRDADPKEGLKKYGATTFADPVNKKYPIDTPGRIKAAWAYIHQPTKAEKYTSQEVRRPERRSPAPLTCVSQRRLVCYWERYCGWPSPLTGCKQGSPDPESVPSGAAVPVKLSGNSH